MAPPAKRDPRFGKGVARPRPQTLSMPTEPLRRRNAPPPRFTCQLGDPIGGDLTVIGHLSSGGKSEIYQVWSISFLCALTCKILLPGWSPQSKEVLAFKREAALLRRLEHPHIVRIFGQGNFEGRDFLIQEFLHGPTLLDLIEAAPHRQLPVPDALKTIIHAGAALDHLHARGYVHRDLKPANLILRGGIPVLVDFDAADRLRPGRKPRRREGTDPYMAPEQCRMEELSPATDIYGLGAVLYELLTGRWPFEEEILRARGQKTLEKRYPQIRGVAPPSPMVFNSKISPPLAAVVLRCLEGTLSRRFPNVRELIKNLAGFLEGKDQMWPDSLDLSRRLVGSEEKG